MKNYKQRIGLGAAIILLLTSCMKNEKEEIDALFPQVRAVNYSWASNDRIGVFMLSNGGTLPGDILTEAGVTADNREYIYSGGDFIPATINNQIYYPNTNSVDFIAYYPYKQTLPNYQYPVDVSNQNSPEDIDLLYAKTTGILKSRNPLEITFAHKLSKLIMNVKAGKGMDETDFTAITATIKGMPTEAKFTLNDQTFSDIGIPPASGFNGKKVLTASGDAATIEAILIPQGKMINRTVVFTVNNKEFIWPIPYEAIFESESQYSWTVLVNKTSVEVVANPIAPWEGTSKQPVGGDAKVNYRIGDYYPDPFVVYNPQKKGEVLSGTAAIGIVFWLDKASYGYDPVKETGYKGKIMSLDVDDKNMFIWGPYITTGANDEEHGQINMIAVKKMDDTYAAYPGFAWVHEKNPTGTTYNEATGIWYLPAKNECVSLCDAIKAGLDDWNSKLIAGGSSSGIGPYSYASSTEYSGTPNTVWSWSWVNRPASVMKDFEIRYIAIREF